MYDYEKAVKCDLNQWLGDNDWKLSVFDFCEMGEEAFTKKLTELTMYDDMVTGWETGYTFGSECAEYIKGNEELAKEAMAFGYGSESAFDEWMREAEADDTAYVNIDTNIRGYLLPKAIAEVVAEIKEHFEKGEDNEND